MASIIDIERKGKYCVVYPFATETGERKQKWETFKTLSEAKRRKAEVESGRSWVIWLYPNAKL